MGCYHNECRNSYRGCLNFTGPTGSTGPTGPSDGPTGPTGSVGPTGPSDGPTGPTGPASTGPFYLFATNRDIDNRDFVGLGSSSESFALNTEIVVTDTIASRLAFTIRYPNSGSYIATLWVNGAPSSLSATIADGCSEISVVGTGSVALQALDLISVRITFGCHHSRDLCKGVAATLFVNV